MSISESYISEDIINSIDAVIQQVDKAIILLQYSDRSLINSRDTQEQCHRATGILLNILTFSHFRRNPHTILTTCSEALTSVCSQLQTSDDHIFCNKQEINLSAKNSTNAESTLDINVELPEYSYTGHSLSDIVGNKSAKSALLENIVLPLTLTKQQSSCIFQVNSISIL